VGNRKCDSCGSTMLLFGSIAVRCLECGRLQGEKPRSADEHENGFREGLRLAMQLARGHGDLAYVPDIVEEIEKCIDPDYEPAPMPDHPEFGPLRERPPCAGSPSCMVGEEGSGTSHGIRCPLFSSENRIAWYKAEIARYRRWLDFAPPFPKTFKPLDDEGLRAIRLRWATGPERYQADADALIFTIAYMRAEHARLRGRGPHPDCELHTEDKKAFADCDGDGHHTCATCTRRTK